MRPEAPSRRLLTLLTAALLLSGLAVGEARSGIIELGRKGQTAGGSTFRVIIDGVPFDPNSHSVGETAESIVAKIVAKINANPLYTATMPDPNDTVFTVLKTAGGEPTTVETFIDDPNIGGTFVDYGSNGGYHAFLRGADVIDPNKAGTLEVDITVHALPTPVVIMISTLGKTATQVNTELSAALIANGIEVFGPPGGPSWDLVKPCFRFERIEMKRTNTGMHISGVRSELDGTTGAPAPSIPTLSEWGLIALTILLSAIAVTLIRRRARGTT